MRNIGTFQVYALVDNMFRTEHYKSAHIANKQGLNTIYICLKNFVTNISNLIGIKSFSEKTESLEQ